MSDDLEIPAFLKRSKDEVPQPIPEDAPELTEGIMSGLGFTADPVNMRKETAGERSKRRRDTDRAYAFVHKVLQHQAKTPAPEMTIGQLVKATEEAHPSDPIPQHAIKLALNRLKREKLVVSTGKWYRWRS